MLTSALRWGSGILEDWLNKGFVGALFDGCGGSVVRITGCCWHLLLLDVGTKMNVCVVWTRQGTLRCQLSVVCCLR